MWLPLKHSLLGTWPATQACALSGNWTGDRLAWRPALNALSHTSRARLHFRSSLFFLSIALVLLNVVSKPGEGEPGHTVLRVHGTRPQAPSWLIIGVRTNPTVFNCCSQVGLPCVPLNTCWLFGGYYVLIYFRHLTTYSCILFFRCLENTNFHIW